MMISQMTEYALRAVVWLARKPDEQIEPKEGRGGSPSLNSAFAAALSQAAFFVFRPRTSWTVAQAMGTAPSSRKTMSARIRIHSRV